MCGRALACIMLFLIGLSLSFLIILVYSCDIEWDKNLFGPLFSIGEGYRDMTIHFWEGILNFNIILKFNRHLLVITSKNGRIYLAKKWQLRAACFQLIFQCDKLSGFTRFYMTLKYIKFPKNWWAIHPCSPFHCQIRAKTVSLRACGVHFVASLLLNMAWI